MDELHRALARRISEDRRRYLYGQASTREYYGRQVHAARLRVSEVQSLHAVLLAEMEQRYVATLNAILSVPGDRESDDDLNRWRGHAEAYRQVCERIRLDEELPPAAYCSGEWREANGVRK